MIEDEEWQVFFKQGHRSCFQRTCLSPQTRLFVDIAESGPLLDTHPAEGVCRKKMHITTPHQTFCGLRRQWKLLLRQGLKCCIHRVYLSPQKNCCPTHSTQTPNNKICIPDVFIRRYCTARYIAVSTLPLSREALTPPKPRTVNTHHNTNNSLPITKKHCLRRLVSCIYHDLLHKHAVVGASRPR